MKIIKYINNKDYIELIIHLEEAIKPYQRNRSGRGHTYDPLNLYKKKLKNELEKLLKDNNIETELEGHCEFNIDYYISYPKSKLTKKKKIAIIDKILKPITKPDIDNIAKNSYDILNGILYKDDAQIISSCIKKYYVINKEEENTVFNIKLYKDKIEIKGR